MNSVKIKRVLSGIQPTGIFTLGNYIGALKNWINLQYENECIYFVVDMHALTVRNDPKKFNDMIYSSYALLLACGVDPEKSSVLVQSHVRGHAELAWLLSCYTQFGELSRMTQFKDKSISNSDNVNVGLFTYPVLQASDILLYDADEIPVGADQKQHVELVRNIAMRFNGIYGDVFRLPNPNIGKNTSKIMSLSDPTKKMSKSDSNVNAYISLLDSPDLILRKFKRATTDSEAKVEFKPSKDGINNLMTIYSAICGKSYDDIEDEFCGEGYGRFKLHVAECVIEHLKPIQSEYNKIVQDREYVLSQMKKGAEKVQPIADNVLSRVYNSIGISF